GVSPAAAKAIVRSRATVIAALMVKRGEADALICGIVGRYTRKLKYLVDVLGLEDGSSAPAALSAVLNRKGTFYFLATHVQDMPTAEQIACATLGATYRLKLFGIQPRVTLLSNSNFGSREDLPAVQRLRDALAIISERDHHLEADGEMQADAALNAAVRDRLFPGSNLSGNANVFVFPNLDAANIAYNLVRAMTDGVGLGPILMGVNAAAHVLTPSATVRRVVNMTAIAAVDAQIRAERATAQ